MLKYCCKILSEKRLWKNCEVPVETGKWLDGSPLNANNKKRHVIQCSNAVFSLRVLKSDQHMTIGEDGQIVT